VTLLFSYRARPGGWQPEILARVIPGGEVIEYIVFGLCTKTRVFKPRTTWRILIRAAWPILLLGSGEASFPTLQEIKTSTTIRNPAIYEPK
jgi:hypothetical protein